MALFNVKNVVFKDIIKYPEIEISGGLATFIRGESGSGKSTLLKLLNGVISLDEGEITYAGKNIEEYQPIALRREVLLVSQSVYLFDGPIRDNFRKFYDYRDLLPISEEAMKSYLDICCLNLPLESACGVLSGGEKQRVFLAISISYRPKVLMLDEPTSALDDKTADELLKNVKSYCKESGITLIVVSHNSAIADKYADHVINLPGGKTL